MRRRFLPLVATTLALLLTAPAQADDNEPNDKRNQATAVVAGRPIAGALDERDDADWYRVDVSGQGDLFAEVMTPSGDFANVVVKLYDDEGAPLGDYGAWVTGPGSVFIEVSAFQDQWIPPPGDYVVTFNHYSYDVEPLEIEEFEVFVDDWEGDGTGGFDDGLDEEVGDAWQNDPVTQAIAPGDVVEGSYDGRGQDPVFEIATDGSGLLLVSLSVEGRSMRGWDGALGAEITKHLDGWAVDVQPARDREGRWWQGGYLDSGRGLVTIVPGIDFS
ncbi:MAG: hypothetical protein HN768_08090 [Rhodospirillaceae bacterium]|nr:hypothetical protein [Rhodospirillaceae bacterium]